MRPRLSHQEITNGLSTNADRIRALARAGYLRTEIRDLLGVRYQQVRKVLEDAGIKEGLQRTISVERSPVEITVPAAPVKPTAGDVLLRAGFQLLGEWRLIEPTEFELSVSAPADPGVYAFVVDGFVLYVGLTQTGLKTRMGHYRRGHEGHRTSSRIKGLIAKALADGKKVQVMIATPGQLEWNGLPVNTAAGLEAGLIRKIRPEWNMLGASRTK